MSAHEVRFEIDGRPLAFREAGVDEILPLRHDVIIVSTNRTEDGFDGDDAPTTHHFAVLEGDEVVACASFMLHQFEGRSAWQLRGMAVAPRWQSRGIGRRLVECAAEALRRYGEGDVMWCNARTPAAPFYRKLGWRIVGDEFDVEGVGPHVRMVCDRREQD
mgnify:CR=1 FL=1